LVKNLPIVLPLKEIKKYQAEYSKYEEFIEDEVSEVMSK
jgi:hypothetical protein